MLNIKKKLKNFTLLLSVVMMMQLSSCCTKPQKVEINGIDLSTVYFPTPPDPIRNGKVIPKKFDKVVIGDIYFESVEVLPYWYWLCIVEYISDTEAMIQSLTALADKEP